MVGKINTKDEIVGCLENQESFVLDAGAGSGKTQSLIDALQFIIERKSAFLKQPGQKVACITFTNRAKDEINERIEYSLYVQISTIHELLWDLISRYRAELRETFSAYLDDLIEEQNEKKQTITAPKQIEKLEEREKKLAEYKNEFLENPSNIEYKDYVKYGEGIISHDDVIVISKKMFENHEKLSRISAGCYPIVFVDEYQDTNKQTVELLYNHLHLKGKSLIAFFGDKMQHIYENGIGEIPTSYELKRIAKRENYRCSLEVIKLLNKIRTDIQQVPGSDKQALGDCRCYYHAGKDINTLEAFIGHLRREWRLDQNVELKQLFLTHRSISKAGDYEELYRLYSYNNKILLQNSESRGLCVHADFLNDLYDLVELYKRGNVHDFLKKTPFKLKSMEDKNKLDQLIKEVDIGFHQWNVERLIEFATNNNLLLKVEKIDVDDKHKSRIERLMVMPAIQLFNLRKFVDDFTPFSTKHGTKGEEYENVIVIIDDNSWTQYSFKQYMEGDKSSNLRRYKRTENLFYVACSRARTNLAILWVSILTEKAKEKLNHLFPDSFFEEKVM